MTKNYYEIFGLKYGASKEEIKKAYKRLAYECHPDKHPGNKEAEERFKLLGIAYQAITGESSKVLESEFNMRGWTDTYGNPLKYEGNLGSKSSILFLIQYLRKHNKNLEKEKSDKILSLYIRNLIQNMRYEDNNEVHAIFDFGLIRIISQVIKEKILTTHIIKKIIHHEFKKLQNEQLHTIEIHIEGIVKVYQKMHINPEPEIKLLRPHALGHIWKYITRVVRYTPYYKKHGINPAHIYFEIKRINEFQKAKLKLTETELQKRNHDVEKRLYHFFYSKLKSEIHMGDNISSAKWYLDMIKYICHLLGNRDRFPHVRDQLIHQFKNHRKGSFEEGILNYINFVDTHNENEFKQQATHQNSATRLLLAKNPI